MPINETMMKIQIEKEMHYPEKCNNRIEFNCHQLLETLIIT